MESLAVSSRRVAFEFAIFTMFATSLASFVRLQPRDDGLQCGSEFGGATCDSDPLNPCCSQYGYCGNTTEFCLASMGCQSGCSDGVSPGISRCGSDFNGTQCPEGCCSKHGYCGITDEYCLASNGCQSGCSGSINGTSIVIPSSTSTVSSARTDTETPIQSSMATGESTPLSLTAKIGIVAGATIFVVCLIVFGIVEFFIRRRRRRKAFEAYFFSNTSSDSGSSRDFTPDPTPGPVPESIPPPLSEHTPDYNPDSVPEPSSAPAPRPLANPQQPPNRIMKVCKRCLELKNIASEFPQRRITTNCTHMSPFCNECLARHIHADLTQEGWEKIRCPALGCTFELEERDIHEFCTEEDYQSYLTIRGREEKRLCDICAEDKLVQTEFPDRPVTDQCTHDPACKTCIKNNIKAALDTGNWTRILCPLCPNQLEFKDIAAFAEAEDFTRYDHLETRRAMELIPDFRWCLRPGCSNGQIHFSGEQLLICNACAYFMCFLHQRPWHEGLTCEQYDSQTRRQACLEEAAVQDVIRRTTKPCPSCNKAIEKTPDTCNHMTCRRPVGCGHEFCYECFVTWTGYGRATTHSPTCSSFTQ